MGPSARRLPVLCGGKWGTWAGVAGIPGAGAMEAWAGVSRALGQAAGQSLGSSPQRWVLRAPSSQEAGSSAWYLVFRVDAVTDAAIIGFCIVYASSKVERGALNQRLEGAPLGFITMYNCIYPFRPPGLWCLVLL